MSSLHYHPPPPSYHSGAPPLPPKPNQRILSLILKAMIMTVITLFFFIFLGVAAILLLLATAAVHRHSTPSSVSSNGFSRKDLKRLPQFKFFKRTTTTAMSHCNETVNNGNECVICLDGIRQGQWCRKLVGCGHMFHKRCVDTWLVKVSTCPVCRTRVTLDSGGLVEDRSLWFSGWRNDLRVWYSTAGLCHKNSRLYKFWLPIYFGVISQLACILIWIAAYGHEYHIHSMEIKPSATSFQRPFQKSVS